MADLSDIESAITTLIGKALFPSITYQQGDYQPSIAIATALPTPNLLNPVPGPLTAKVYRGWPTGANLNADMALNRVHVSIYSDPGAVRNVTRWFPQAVQVSVVAPTISATASGASVTLSGTITAGNVVGIQAGTPLRAYAYIVQSADTITTVAAALTAKISGATSAGAVITLPTALYVTALTMMPQTVMTVTRQQEQGIRISIWAPTPQARDVVCGLIDNALAALKSPSGMLTRFFAVGLYEAARLVYRAVNSNDMPARDRVWRRDVCYTVEYPTTLIEQDPAVMFIGGTETIGITGTTRQMGAIAPS